MLEGAQGRVISLSPSRLQIKGEAPGSGLGRMIGAESLCRSGRANGASRGASQGARGAAPQGCVIVPLGSQAAKASVPGVMPALPILVRPMPGRPATHGGDADSGDPRRGEQARHARQGELGGPSGRSGPSGRRPGGRHSALRQCAIGGGASGLGCRNARRNPCDRRAGHRPIRSDLRRSRSGGRSILRQPCLRQARQGEEGGCCGRAAKRAGCAIVVHGSNNALRRIRSPQAHKYWTSRRAVVDEAILAAVIACTLDEPAAFRVRCAQVRCAAFDRARPGSYMAASLGRFEQDGSMRGDLSGKEAIPGFIRRVRLLAAGCSHAGNPRAVRPFRVSEDLPRGR